MPALEVTVPDGFCVPAAGNAEPVGEALASDEVEPDGMAETELTGGCLEANDHRPFNESMWDACSFLYLKQVRLTDSTLGLVVMLLNVTMQVGFCVVVWTHMLEPSISNESLHELLRFRVGVAHSMDLSDKHDHKSLVSHICAEGGNDKVHAAAGQRDLQQGIQHFRRGGIPLTILVQVVWLGSVLKELINCCHFASGIANLPRGAKTLITSRSSAGQLTTSIKCISRARLAWVMLVVVVPRFIIGVVIGFTGVRFLSATESMENLVLNAVALTFVFELDELFFEMLAPRPLHVLVTTLEPLSPSSVRGDVVTTLQIAAMLTAILTILYTLTFPFHWQLMMAYEILCGGVQDFVYAENKATEMLHVARTATDDSGWSPRELAILQVTQIQLEDKYGWGIDPELVRVARSGQVTAMPTTGWSVRPDLQSLETVERFSSEAFQVLLDLERFSIADVSNIRACEDLTRSNAVRNFMSDQLGVGSFGCEDIMQSPRLQRKCSQQNMTFLRALCPIACGCGGDMLESAYAGLFDSVEFGCPKACYELWMVHKASRSSWPDWVGHSNNWALDNPLANMKDQTDGATGEAVYLWVRRYFKGLPEYMFARQNERQRLTDQLHNIPGICAGGDQDQPAPGCVTTGEFVRFVKDGEIATSMLDGKWRLHWDLPHPRGLTGCAYLISYELVAILGMNLCSVGRFASIRPICPHECGCTDGRRMSECPFKPDIF